MILTKITISTNDYQKKQDSYMYYIIIYYIDIYYPDNILFTNPFQLNTDLLQNVTNLYRIGRDLIKHPTEHRLNPSRWVINMKMSIQSNVHDPLTTTSNKEDFFEIFQKF